ncbi:MAG: hypothetical protein NVSMB65_00470 [Chloroflexota bacterium]
MFPGKPIVITPGLPRRDLRQRGPWHTIMEYEAADEVRRKEHAMSRVIPAPARPIEAAGSHPPAWGDQALAVWGALALYALCTCVLFWPVVRDLGTALPQDLGDPPMQAWIIGWDVHALLTAPGHLWDANIFYPAHDVLAYQDNLLALVPLAAPLLLVSHNPLLSYNVLFLVSFALSGWWAFLFVRYIVRDAGVGAESALPAAFLGGLIYAFLPFKMSHLGHLNLLSTEPLPLIFLFWECAWRQRRWQWWAALAVSLVGQALCSLHYAVYAGLGLVFLLALRVRQEGARRAPWRALLLTAGGTGMALLPIALPYLRVVRALGTQRPLGEVVALSPDLHDLLHTSPRSLLYGWTDAVFPPHVAFSPQYLFPGLVPLVLAVVGWAALRRRPTANRPVVSVPARGVRPYGWLGLSALVLAFGPFLRLGGVATPLPLPYLLPYAIVPGFRGLRDPARFAILAGLCLGLLAAWGAVHLVRRRRVLWLLLGALVLLEYAVGPVPMPRVASGAGIPPVYAWLARQPGAGAVLELPIGLSTVRLWSEQTLMMYYSTYHWKPIVNGAPGFLPRDYERLLPVWASFPSPAALSALHQQGIRYVIVHGTWMGSGAAARIAARARVQGVRVAARFGTDTVYRP